VIAGQIRRALGAGLFEIQTAAPYPEDYEATVEQARQERDRGYEPPLKAMMAREDLTACETLFLGFPIWGQTAPPAIRSFLSRHDLAGKTLIPFVTHGGYGLGDSLSVLARHAPQARLREGFSLQADQERDTLNKVTRWLGETLPSQR
jgi:flavodoxin